MVIRWKWSSGGQYSAKSFYATYMGGGKTSWGFPEIWKCKIPATVKIFVFLTLQDRILTQDRLQIFHIPFRQGCHMCKNSVLETGVHLLFFCPYARQVWALLAARLNLSLLISGVRIEDVWCCSREGRGSRSTKEWCLWFSCALWHIWKQRNERVFRNQEMSPKHLVDRILLVGKSWKEYG